ncbi:hypothetical protein BJ875DRAFT_177511 [Amylocarpus encephaloides]|uniref:Ankyrin repeat protein n=1 Tax=Amylocarpus encephaloides TaxID=45428 RepID=A0A9P8C237_9HELO|nr:hypothetical protein BJ875DRAFT_177511 [Amylocarpus encephaloides]
MPAFCTRTMPSKIPEVVTEAEGTAVVSSEGDFVPLDIPDRLQDDPLIEYFRIRYEKRESYLSKLRNAEGTEDQKKKKDIEANRIDTELDRIKTLRSSFATTPENKRVIRDFDRCRTQWKNHAIASRHKNLKTLEKRVEDMDLEKDEPLRRKIWELRILNEVTEWKETQLPTVPKYSEDEKQMQEKDQKEAKPSNKKPRRKSDAPKEKRLRPMDSYGLTVTKITLRKSNKKFSSSFMSYDIKKYPLDQCLFEDGPKNPLTEKCELDTIRYFHIPANNMQWIEEAIGRYYGEKTPGEYNYRQSIDYLKKSSDLLCREFWTSKQHGGTYDPVHARHMRANCSCITTETKCSDGRPTNNLVIFMPYLHWESHKRRKKMAEETAKLTQKHQETRSHVTETPNAEFMKTVAQIKIDHARALTGYSTLADSEKKEEKAQDPKPSKYGPLGEYLLHIAKLYDAMDIEPDVRLLRDYLFQNPPLHSRRTLDQSYYWKLANTDARDQDQVVYRETKEGKNIARTTRVVMVDQLWMYILDDNTIITSFPRRWGRNKPDHSGVHKGIRARLNHLRAQQIQSVYDLGLLILNQCSTVFFDLTKPVDERPEVIDIFSNALSHVSGMKTMAYETFWRHLDKLNATDRHLGFEATARSYLNINPEGELLKEVHDIIEELRMMARIYTQQLNIIEDFSGHLEKWHQEDEKKWPEDMIDIILEIKNHLLKPANQPHSAEDPLGPQHNHSPTPKGDLVTNGVQNGHNTETDAKAISDNTIKFAKRVGNEIRLRRQELQNLEEHSTAVSDQLNHLLSLKQQHASIIEAKLALKRADESVTQGRSIMLFTIVTIIFLPLSFMTSVFGMNSSGFDAPGGGNSMSLQHQFKLIFPISFGVIVVSISLAFSPWIRSIIAFVTHITFASLIEYTKVRHAWLWCIRKRPRAPDKRIRHHTADALYLNKQDIVRKIYSRKERAEAMRSKAEAMRLDERRDGGDSMV